MDKIEAFGWFGIPWPSGICYDDDGRLIEEMHKPFPTGESCLFCNEVFDEAAGDSGKAIPSPGGEIRHAHKECMLLIVAGTLSYGLDLPKEFSRRNATIVWDRLIAQYGTPPTT